MKAAEILDLEHLVFLDPSFSSLADDLPLAVPEGITGSRLLVDEREDLLAVAFQLRAEWYATTFLYRRPDPDLLDRCEEVDLEIYQESRKAWAGAVREYYSLALAREVSPALDDLAPDREQKLEALLRSIWGRPAPGECLDCCCGSGVGSAVIRRMGMQPLSYDNDAALLARGLSAGRLLPQESMWIDAARAGEYLDPVPRGIAVMLGEINSFTAGMWEEILGQFLLLAREVIITVGTEGEAQRVGEWVSAGGAEVRIHENDRDPFYDRWVCEVPPHG
ncbi:MAG: hypothetical protein LUQ62_03050 [Methanomicrobiales archaeon]|nr:hypothetical protein [Methanomicrobiales archaeon]